MLVREVFVDAKTGERGERWVEIPGVISEADGIARDQLQRKAEVRTERSRRLRACDWTTLPDVPLSDELRAAWLIYRQALRDVPEQPAFPDVKWPQAPA